MSDNITVMSISKSMEIGVKYKNVRINEFTVKRDGDEHSIYFEFTSDQGSCKVKIKGIRDTYNLCELLEAESIWLKEGSNSQAEFGRYTLGIQEETYTEIIFDSIA